MNTGGSIIQKKLLLFSDGGARGNPGPAAAAFIAMLDNGQIITVNSRYLGIRTNNQAEYEALIAALQFAVNNNVEEVICYLDSELVTKQLTGEYSVKNSALKKLWSKAKELSRCFKKASFVSVPRTNHYIQRADALVNQTLDEAMSNSL
ncbi:MAG: ribonuclease HI family protein [Candidatus Bathyarchaeota archaeon]|nr:ribonuclease HI family protein [Candidatus Bathyarchaeota archaeon]